MRRILGLDREYSSCSSLRVFLPEVQQPLRSAQTDWDERDVAKQTLNISVSDSVVSDLP